VRHVQVHTSAGGADRILEIGREHGAVSPVRLPSVGDGGGTQVVLLTLPNAAVGEFVRQAGEAVDDARFLIFREVLPVSTPLDDVRGRLRDVDHRSTLELVLGALQSVGSWKGLVFYAVFSGIIAAYGLLVNAGYMLVAAMLVAPVGAPVMVATVGAAVGDVRMIGRGAVRFVAAVAILVVAAVAMGYLYGLDASTGMMEQVTSLSVGGALVALVAGAAGAQSLVQSERASLVGATSAGFLVAAALSPTAAVLGMSIPLQRWDYVGLMGYQLALQFAALSLGGWLILVVYGVRASDPTAGRGSGMLRWMSAAGLAAAAAGLLALQLALSPRFTKADVARSVAEAAVREIRTIPGSSLVEVDARFPRSAPHGDGRHVVLVDVRVEAFAGAYSDDAEIDTLVREAVRRAAASVRPAVGALVNVSVHRQ
jgi:hypothetical protein